VTPARRLRRANSEELEELFSTLDVTGDERVHYLNFIAAAMEAHSKLREDHQVARTLFNRLDDDHSGTIGTGDLRAVLGASFDDTDIAELVGELDSGVRGEMSFDAFARTLSNKGIVAPSFMPKGGVRGSCVGGGHAKASGLPTLLATPAAAVHKAIATTPRFKGESMCSAPSCR